MMNRKGAIELSANFIVVIVISMVILAGGLALFFKIKKGAETQADIVSSQIEEDLKSMMLRNGARVAVYPTELFLSAGDSDVIGLGITNIYDRSVYFVIAVTVTHFIDSETPGSPIVSSDFYSIPSDISGIQIIQKDQKVNSIVLKIPKGSPEGQYIYTIIVSDDVGNYGTVQVFVTTK